MSKKATNSKKKQDDGGVLPKIELLFIFIFFLVFITWAMSKCGSVQEEYAEEAKSNIPLTETAKVSEQEKKIVTKSVDTTKKIALLKAAKSPVKIEKRTVLYVLLDGLKLRKGHHLDSSIVKTLKLDDEVYYLNETTDFKQKINLGDRMAYEPWVKVRAYTGHEGWVYGAGVHYFKPKAVVDTLGQ